MVARENKSVGSMEAMASEKETVGSSVVALCNVMIDMAMDPLEPTAVLLRSTSTLRQSGDCN